MKRTLLIILSCVVVLLGALFLGVSYFSTAIFGENAKEGCGNKVVNSIPIGDGKITVTVEDDMCDSGLVVFGAFKVVLRYREHERVVEKILLVANSMGSNSRPPEVKVLAPNALLISGQKDMVVEKGPAETAGIQLTYELK